MRSVVLGKTGERLLTGKDFETDTEVSKEDRKLTFECDRARIGKKCW